MNNNSILQKRRLSPYFGSLLMATTILCTTSFVEARGHKGPKDLNQDGVITLEEVHTHVENKFSRKDSNNDGVITLDEMKSRATERFNRMDKNQDGQITEDEKRSRGRGRHQGPNPETSQQ